VDKLIKMIKLKMPDATIVNAAHAEGASARLTADDLIRLKEAGASDVLLVELSGPPSAAKAGTEPSTVSDRAGSPSIPPASAAPYNTDLGGLSCEVPAGERKRIIAVKTFDFGAVKTKDQSVFNTLAAIGNGMTALAVKRVQEAGKYRVVERENVQDVLKEQDFGASPRTQQGKQARIGKILGADAILMGTITVFGRDDKKNGVGGGGWGPSWLSGLKLHWGKDKAVVAINYRLIDAETSETISVGEARGESERKSKGLDIAALTSSGGGAGGLDMTSSNFAETIVGEATINCMNKLIDILNQKEKDIRLRNIDIDTRVALVSGAQIYISSGANEGVQKCDRFEVSRIVSEIRDPVTKDLLDLQLEKVGDLIVTEVREKMAIGAFNGNSAPVVGYAVRKLAPTSAQPNQKQ
jgi:curli biogenesis system outer membrane secretion channel CsgG